MRTETMISYEEITLMSETGVTGAANGSLVPTLRKALTSSGEKGAPVGNTPGGRFFLDLTDGGGAVTVTVEALVGGTWYTLLTFTTTATGTEIQALDYIPDNLRATYSESGGTGADVDVTLVRF